MPTLLLNVDDSVPSRHARSQALRQAGFDVLEAGTGNDALALVKKEHPALVLLDVNLPDLSGFEVCRLIKDNPVTAAIPVLHVSATAIEEHDLITGLQAADAYLVEPVPPPVLLAFVQAVLRGRELLQQWVSVFDALSDGVALLSAEGKILRCNSAFCRLMHRRIGQVLGHSIMEIEEGADCAGQELPFSRSLRSRQSETVECLFGDNIYRLTSHVALVQAKVAGAIYLISDVTQERRAAREKDEAFAQLRALTDSAPVGFIFFDRDMRYGLVNKKLAELNGGSVEDHLGRTPEEVLPGRAAEARRLFQQVVDTGQPIIDHEFTSETPDRPGEARSWAENWYPVRSANGRLIGVGVTSIETTERKRAAEAQKALEARIFDAQKIESIGFLAGGIAHDFNNLLTGVLGNASLAREMAPTGSPVARCLEEIIHASERAAHLTKQMLAYAGKGKFVTRALDLSRETEEVLRLLHASISKRIEVRLDLADELPALDADPGQVQQVIMNLVVNAAEAIGDSHGQIDIRTGAREGGAPVTDRAPGEDAPGGPYVFLEVRDTGCGMDEATKAKIFDPFFTTKFTGRGLGLAAVGGIIRGHQGVIEVNSAPNQGSTFVVWFPAGAEAAAEPVAPRQVTQGAGAQAGETILVVDDEQVVLRTAQAALQRRGYTVLPAESGPAAIDIIRQRAQDVSLVILDLSMPGMSGQETLPEIRKVRPDVPVVVSSGYNEEETMRLFSGQWISGFLQKPYTILRLAERVEEALAAERPLRP
jgi:two-component system cell cycle sensor histidine kinase/response regulator CckA